MTQQEAKVQVLLKLGGLSVAISTLEKSPKLNASEYRAKTKEVHTLIAEIKALCVMWGT